MIPVLNFGFFQIPTFFLVISLSLSGLLVYLSHRVDRFGKDRTHAFNIALILMVFGFLGGRLLHIFYEELAYYRINPIHVFYFWNGGFVFYGGFITAILAGFFYCRLRKISFFEWADFLAPLGSLSHALGRLGCVLAGCCFGKACDLPWALDGRHPTAWYLVIGEFIIFGILLLLEKRQTLTKNQQGQLFFKWVFLHSFLRFVVEFYRDDFRGEFVGIPLLGMISVSQFLCVILMVICLGFFVNLRKQNSH